MEDFDYIDALAKSELLGREVTPSENGWNIVQEKLKRKRQKRKFFFILLFFAMVSSIGVYYGVNFNSDINDNSITNKNIEKYKSGTTKNASHKKTIEVGSLSISDSTLNSNNISQAEKNAMRLHDKRQDVNQNRNDLQESGNGIVKTSSKVHSRESDIKNNTIYKRNIKNQKETVNISQQTIQFAVNKEALFEAKGAKIYDWQLFPTELLKSKKRTTEKKKSTQEASKNMDIMVGTNGFFSPNDYQLLKSYVVEFSFEFQKELKKDYLFNYGTGLQFRNLYYEKDNERFNKGELSLTIFSNIEKQFGDFSVEAGAYVGYEIYSPNNKFFNDKVSGFFNKKINYGLSTGFNYKNVGLIFKYEISPYINFLGDKKYGGFIIGVKYDF